MTLPTTYLACLLVSIFSLLCGVAWANSVKLSGKRRFELFYFDFAAGLMLTAVVVAFTLGTLGTDGFVLMDDFLHAGKRNIAAAIAAGVIFNLGNFLLVAAIKMAGLKVAFPIGFGLAFAAWNVLAQVVDGQGQPGLVFAGAAVLVAAAIFEMLAFRGVSLHQEVEKMKAGEHRTLRPSVAWKAVLLSVIGGLLIGATQPLVQFSKTGEIGLGPYALGFSFCLGVFFSTFVFNLYFMNLPLMGAPLEMRDYFRGKAKGRLIGLLSGVVWCLGLMAGIVAASASLDTGFNPVLACWLSGGFVPLGALSGILAWRELSGAGPKTRGLVVVMLFLLLAGLGLVAAAQTAAPG